MISVMFYILGLACYLVVAAVVMALVCACLHIQVLMGGGYVHFGTIDRLIAGRRDAVSSTGVWLVDPADFQDEEASPPSGILGE